MDVTQHANVAPSTRHRFPYNVDVFHKDTLLMFRIRLMLTIKRMVAGITFCAFFLHGVALANVPVVNISGDGTVASTSNADSSYGDTASSLSTDERLAVLERQIANLNKQNVSTKLNDLQNQLQELQGKVDEVTHQNQALADQMKQQYQDINSRLNEASSASMNVDNKAVATNDAATPAVVTPTLKGKSKVKAKAVANADTNVDANADLNATTAATGADDQAETAAYQKGFDLLKKGDYVRAAPAFENFLKAYPSGEHAPNAHFWLGEIHLAQNQADAAASEYRRVINDYPTSDKVQMAQLKLGFAYHDQNELCKAKSAFDKVIKLYPKTTAATMAKKALVDIPSPCSTASHKNS
jgi:tol-pal system protein YbgF